MGEVPGFVDRDSHKSDRGKALAARIESANRVEDLLARNQWNKEAALLVSQGTTGNGDPSVVPQGEKSEQ